MQTPHDPLSHLANLQFAEQFFARLLLFPFQDRPMAQHQILSLRVGFGDNARQRLADERLQVFHAEERDLADGDEAANVVDFALQASLVVAGDAGVDHDAFRQVRPVLHIDRGPGNSSARRDCRRAESGRGPPPVCVRRPAARETA